MKLIFDTQDFTRFAQAVCERNAAEPVLERILEENGIVPASSMPEIADWSTDGNGNDVVTITVYNPEDWSIESETWVRDADDEYAEWRHWGVERDADTLITVDMAVFAGVAAPLAVAA